MKRIRLICSYYQGRVKSVVFITLVFTFLLFFFLFKSSGTFAITESMKLYQNADLKNSIYFMPAADLYEFDGSRIQPQELEAFAAVKDVLYDHHSVFVNDHDANGIYNVDLYTDAMAAVFPLEVEGQWLTDLPPQADEDYINAVVCGNEFADLNIGDFIHVTEAYMSESLRVRVAGKSGEKTALPIFGTMHSAVTTDEIFHMTEITIIMLKDNYAKFRGTKALDTFNISYGGFIRFQEDATSAELEELEAYLNDTGGYATYDALMENSQERYLYKLRTELAMPLLLLGISLLAFVAIFVLIMNTKTIEMRAYFLCGYSKRQAFMDFFLSMLLTIFVPSLICTLFVLKFPPMQTELVLYYLWAGSWDSGNKALGPSTLVFMAGYFAVCMGLALLLSFQFIKKSSVIELYRREI